MNWQAVNLSAEEMKTAYTEKGKPDMITHRGYSLLHVVTS